MFANRNFIFLAALAYFFLFVILYSFFMDAYFGILHRYSFGVWKYPFLDFEAIPAALECWSRGINVYVSNPCDSLGRSGVYSPFWLWLPVLPTGPWWTAFYGICLALGFCASLTVLPPASGLTNRMILLAAIVSPDVVFAVERANIDLGVFIGAAIFLLLFERSIGFRMAGYALALILGLAKWYPMTILVLALRERLGVFLTTAAASLMVFILLVVVMFDQVKSVITYAYIPISTTTYDVFGVTQFVALLQDVGRHAVAIDLPQGGLHLGLMLGSFAIAIVLAVNLPALRASDTLQGRALNCLLVGCLLFAGCYLAGPSVGYRGIMLMFVLPSVLILANRRRDPAEKWFWLGLALLILAQLWMLRLGWLVSYHTGWFSQAEGVLAGPKGALGFVMFREIAGWLIATIFKAVVLRWAFRSPAIAEAQALVRRVAVTARREGIP
jgi:hypothetical protein